jgi:hypothetical protein
MATHELERAARLASRIIILSRGLVGFDAPTDHMDAAGLAARYAEVTA